MVEGEEAEGREGQGEEGGEVCHFVWGSFAGRRDCLLRWEIWSCGWFCCFVKGPQGLLGRMVSDAMTSLWTAERREWSGVRTDRTGQRMTGVTKYDNADCTLGRFS